MGERLLGAAVSLLAVIFTSFFLFRIIPGDPVRVMTHGRPVTIEQKAALRREFGLDEPLWSSSSTTCAGCWLRLR